MRQFVEVFVKVCHALSMYLPGRTMKKLASVVGVPTNIQTRAFPAFQS